MLRGSYCYPELELGQHDEEKNMDFKELLNKGLNGTPVEQFKLGLFYEQGIGTRRDLPAALYWITKASDKHCEYACYHLFHIYENGIGIEKDSPKALVHLEKAANGGIADAKCELAWREAHGLIDSQGKPNYEKTITYYREAAALNAPLAYYNLAWIFEHPAVFGQKNSQVDIVQDYHIKASGSEGEEGALAHLALIARDLLESWNTFIANTSIAALQTHPCLEELRKHYRKWRADLTNNATPESIKASLNCRLGVAYLLGLALRQDLAEAEKLFTAAEKFGHPKARAFIEISKPRPSKLLMFGRAVSPFPPAGEGSRLIHGSQPSNVNIEEIHTRRCPLTCRIL